MNEDAESNYFFYSNERSTFDVQATFLSTSIFYSTLTSSAVNRKKPLGAFKLLTPTSYRLIQKRP
jgi:hypothetical protein